MISTEPDAATPTAIAERAWSRVRGGDSSALPALIHSLTPVVHARVTRALFSPGRGSRGRDVRQEVADMAQETLCELFADDAKVLRDWDPARGASLLNFVGLVAERRVGHFLRSKRRNPWSNDPTEADALDAHAGASEAPSPEKQVATRELLDRVWTALRAELSPKGVSMFDRLFVEERSMDELCAEAQMKPDAVYAWKSRLAKRARALLAEAMSERPVSSATPKHEFADRARGDSPATASAPREPRP